MPYAAADQARAAASEAVFGLPAGALSRAVSDAVIGLAGNWTKAGNCQLVKDWIDGERFRLSYGHF